MKRIERIEDNVIYVANTEKLSVNKMSKPS